MQLSVERIRWGLLAGALLLIAIVMGLLSYGRYRALKAWRQILARSGATITHESDGVTYTQALRGKTVFTLHAARAIPHGDGKYTLKDGMLLLYGPDGQPQDRIYGAEIEYDQNAGVARAAGEVNMDIQPPAALSSGSAKSSASAPAPIIHVRTSGLTYIRKLRVAATDQEVEIDYAGLRGWSRGAEFDSGQSMIHLLADVHADGTLHGAPATLHASAADLDRQQSLITLAAPVLHSTGHTATARGAVLHLRKDGSLALADAEGAVTLAQGTRTITSSTLHAALGTQSQLQTALLAGGVALADSNPLRPMQGSAHSARVACDPQGRPADILLEGAVALSMTDHRPGAPALARQLGAQQVDLTLVHIQNTSRLSSVHATGAAWAVGDSPTAAGGGRTAGLKHTEIAADDLRLTLTASPNGRSQPDLLTGADHTRLEQRLPDGVLQTSTGDTLEARFAPAGSGVEIASATQTGGVHLHSAPAKPGELPSDGTAATAAFDGPANTLTLTGHPHLTRGDTAVTADTLRLVENTGDAFASGAVALTFADPNAKSGAPVTHGLAADAVLHRPAYGASSNPAVPANRTGDETLELHGTDANPARLWQGAAQVQAANLLLDRARDAFHAWPATPQGNVLAVFAATAEPLPPPPSAPAAAASTSANPAKPHTATPRGDRVVRVTTARLDYSGQTHEAVFSGGVLAQGQDGVAHAQRGIAFLTPKPASANAPASNNKAAQPDPVAASLDRIVLSGDVRLTQPGRVATGEQLLYTALSGEYVLTGTPAHPPHVVDDTQGSITGATLLFHSPDSTIVVAGGPASRRVHTETTLRK
jgi:lipopolysaccharide export system protein LptA